MYAQEVAPVFPKRRVCVKPPVANCIIIRLKNVIVLMVSINKHSREPKDFLKLFVFLRVFVFLIKKNEDATRFQPLEYTNRGVF